MDKMSSQITDLLNPLIPAEESARYFYEAARTWARGKGYCGAERQFKCYVHYHKHNLKCLLNIFADWGGKPTYEGIAAPAAYFVELPDVLNDAASLEESLMGQYDKVARALMQIHLGIFDEINKLRQRETGFYQEMDEFVDKLKLFNTKNGLDLVYFDRKILRW